MFQNSLNKNLEKKVPVETYSRVVGYYRPVNQWNIGKQAEFMDRVEYDIKGKPIKKQIKK
jgi:anaerobic ribonucleoside-triphosphate reductase